MKTPMQRLLDVLEGGFIIGDVKPSVLVKFIKGELVEYEQKIIKQSFYDGIVCSISDQDTDMLKLSEQYYNETFNTKDK